MARKIKVFLVDHHNLIRAGLSQILSTAEDIELIGTALDGAEVLKFTGSVPIDVLILDVTLHNVVQIIKHLTNHKPTVNILLLAIDCNVQQAIQLLNLGATGYLCTRATPKDLITAIRHVSRGETIVSPKVTRGVVEQLAQHQTDSPHSDELHTLLTEREIEVLQLLCQGLTDKEISEQLHISIRTVNGHLSHIYTKLDVRSRTETMHLVLEKGWIKLE